MAEQKSGTATVLKMAFYTAVGPILAAAVLAFGVWIWTLLT